MAPPRNSASASTLPDNVPLTLPPLDPPAKKGASTPVVYNVRLSEDVVNALLSADNPTITFSSDTKGVLSVQRQRDIPFTARPVAAPSAETARSVLYSRRAARLRTVGPVTAELELEHRLSAHMSDVTKKRSIDATLGKTGREVKKLESLPADLPASKRPRVAKQTSKRPRPSARRPSLTSQPAPLIPPSKPLPAPPSSSAAPPHHLNQPSSRTPPRPSSSLALPLRSAPPSSTSAAHSPASPARPSNHHHHHLNNNSSNNNGNHAPHPRPLSRPGPTVPQSQPPASSSGAAKRSTPTRSSLGGMQRKHSPASALPPATLPRPATRRGPSASTPGSSRGPSPARPLPTPPRSSSQPHASNSSPRSPRLSGLRSRPRDRTADLRRTVVHALALRECTMSSLKTRVRADDGTETHGLLVRIVHDVADKRAGMLRLKDDLWGEVSDGYEGYSDEERARVRGARPDAPGSRGASGGGGGGNTGTGRGLMEPNTGAGSAGNGSGGSGSGHANGTVDTAKVGELGRHGMSDSQLDDRLEAYERDEGALRVGKVASEDDESELRRRFTKWFPVYHAMLGRLDDLRRMFGALEKSLGDALGARDREAVVREIHATHHRYRARHARYQRMLPMLHRRLKEMHRALGSTADPML